MNNPINLGNIKASGGYISAEKDSLFEDIKLIKGEGPFLLLLFSVDFHDIDVDVVEKIRVEFNTIARREEDHNFIFFLLLLP